AEPVCDFPPATPVQQVLERLCREKDLRFHNQHLHGWGVVCGLQVHCADRASATPSLGSAIPRESVTVRSGYAIDPFGNDILIDSDRIVNVMDLVRQAGIALDPKLGADVTLSIALAGNTPQFAVAPYSCSDKTFSDWRSLLEGTLLLDFY